MVHKKYITRGGKTYGPYYYESYRENGRVKKKYIGMESGSNSFSLNNIFSPSNKSFTLQIFIVAVLILSIASIGYYTMSGHSVSDIPSSDGNSNQGSDNAAAAQSNSDNSASSQSSDTSETPPNSNSNPSENTLPSSDTSETSSTSDQSSNSESSSDSNSNIPENIPSNAQEIVSETPAAENNPEIQIDVAQNDSENNENSDEITEPEQNNTEPTVENDTIPETTNETDVEQQTNITSNETIVNETVIEVIPALNESIVNETELPIVPIIPILNETIVNQTEYNLSLIADIPTIRISKNSSSEIDLTEFFFGAESYSIAVEDIQSTFNNNILTLAAINDFSGARQAKVTAYYENLSVEGNTFTILVSSGAISIKTSREQIKVGEDVKWTKNVSMEEAQTLSVQLPAEATEILVTQIEDAVVSSVSTSITGNAILAQDDGESWFSNLFASILSFFSNTITGNVVAEEINSSMPIEVTLDNNSTQYIIEYTTPGPVAQETLISKGKQVSITASEQLNYTDVIASTTLENSLSVNSASTIKVRWHNYDVEAVAAAKSNDAAALSSISQESKEVSEVPNSSIVEEIIIVNESTEIINSVVEAAQETQVNQSITSQFSSVLLDANGSEYVLQDVPFDFYDLNNDGKLDYIEWVVPHFSEQIYDIILITNAEHLDENRVFIENIYGQLKEIDGVTSIIPAGEYVRVTFEINLSSTRDITIYANASEDATVKVYEKDSGTELAVFTNITGFEKRQILLTNMGNGTQDTFDLLVQGSDVEFDHVVDPQMNNLVEMGLVALWHLNNDSAYGENSTYIYDSTGNGNNGTAIAGAVANTSGKFEGAYRFDGETGYLNFGNTLNLTGNISVSAWFNAANNESSLSQVIACRGLWNTGVDQGQWCLTLASSRPQFYVSNGTASISPNTGWFINRSQWYHIVGTFNGTASKVYINGVLQATDNDANFGGRLNGAVSSPYSVTAIGDRAAGQAYYFNGSIDEVAVYNRTLSASDVLRLYQQGSDIPIVWNCTTGTNNFSFAGCWNLGRVPVGNDNVIFNGTGVGNVNITSNVMPQNLNSFIVASTYTGTIHFNSKFAQGLWKEPIEKGIYYNDSTTLPVLVYRFNNDATFGEDSSTVNDFSANGNDGTISGSPVANPSGGILGTGAYEFNGVGDYISSSSTPSVNVNLNNNLTVSFWFKNAQSDVAANGYLIYARNGSSSDLFNIYVGVSERLTSNVYNESGGISSFESTSGLLADTNWHHGLLRVELTGTNTYNKTIWLDGNVVMSGTNTGPMRTGLARIHLGATATPNQYFNGSIDEVALFNRSLTVSEIKTLYSRGLNGTQEWNVTSNISINGGTMKIYGDYPAIIRAEGNGQVWKSLQGNIIINSSGKLDGVGLGFATLTGPGSTGGSLYGAAHAGGTIPSSGTVVYDMYGDLMAPTSLGSGGGDGPGGSAIKLDASSGNVIINGNVNMTGTATSHYNGAGGSIWIKALNISGIGYLRSEGGQIGGGSGGGGGYIRLEYLQAMNYTGYLSTKGGRLASKYGEDGKLTFTNNTWPGDWIVNGTTGLAGGDYGDGNVIQVQGNFVLNGNNLTIYGDCYANSIAKTCYNTTNQGLGVWINASGNINISSNARLSGFSDLGGMAYGLYSGGPGTQGGGSYGAGHGGLGGYDSGTSGYIYGSAEAPTALGSAGAGSQPARGGSAIRLSSQSNITIDGRIIMDAGGIGFAHGGSGGSIFIEGQRIFGNGNLSAIGGGITYGGGGGRVAFVANSTIEFRGIVNTSGFISSYNGSGGTFYASAGSMINMTGKVISIGRSGGLINITDTTLSLQGFYNASNVGSGGSNGNVTLNYSDCVNTDINGFYNPNFIDQSSCGVTYIDSCGILSTPNMQYALTHNISSASLYCFNVTANNVSIDGRGYSVNYSSGSALVITNVNGTTLKNTVIKEGTSAATAIISNVPAGQYIIDVKIINNTITTARAGSHAIYLTAVKYGVIANNTLSVSGGSGASAIVFTQSNYPDQCSEYNTMDNNKIYVSAYGASGIVTGGGSLYCTTNGNIISNNNITASGQVGVGILSALSGNFTIINNTIGISSTATYAMALTISNSSIINNTVQSTTTSPGIYITTGNANTLTGNRINTSQALGFEFIGTTAEHFNNTLDSSNLVEGLPLSYAQYKTNVPAGGAQEVGTLDDYLTNGLVGLWHLNNESRYGENATAVYDFSGNENNGTTTGGAIANNSGKLRGAYSFDGLNDGVFLGQPSMFNMTSSNNFAFSVWINPAQNETAPMHIFSRGSVQSGADQIIYGLATFSAGGSRPYAQVSDGASALSILTATGTLSVGSWQMLTVSYNGTSKNISIYKNGAIVGSNQNSSFGNVWDGGSSPTARNTGIGYDSKGDTYFFNGSIDEVAVWNRSLSQSEITALYNKQVGKFENVYGQVVCSGCNNVTYDGINMSSDGFAFLNTANSSIINSRVNTANGHGIYSSLSTNNTFFNNRINTTTASYGYGIYSLSSHFNNITNNTINTTGSFSYGIYLLTSSNNTLFENTITTGASSARGMYLQSSASGNRILNNIITTRGSSAHSLYIITSSSSNYIANNILNGTFTGDGNPTGFGLYTSTHNTYLVNNTIITAWGTAVNIGGSGGTSFANTTFINNRIYNRYTGYCTFRVQTHEHNLTMIDNILNSSTPGMEFCLPSTGLPSGNAIWNLTNVTREDGNPINVSWAAGANGTLNMMWYMNPITVVNQTGMPLSGVNVSVWNSNNVFQFSEITDSYGNISQKIVLGYTRTNTSSGGYTDTFYSPYSLNATKIDYVNVRNTTINVTLNTFVNVSMHQLTARVSFVNPTPSNATIQSANSIPVNVSTNSSYDHYVLTDFDNSLVLWHRMENLNSTGNGVVDSGPYSINGTIVGGAVQNTSGRFGKSMSFDGVTGIIALNNDSLLSPGNSNFSISAWAYYNSNGTNQYIYYDRFLGGASIGLGSITLGRISFDITNNSGSSTGITSSSGTMQNDRWYHVVATKVGTNMSLYVNGIINSTNDATPTGPIDTVGSYQAFIGASASTFFNGSIDEVIILNRSLSAGEISSLYNASATKYYNNFTGLARRSPLYSITSYAVDLAGNLNQTETRYISIPATTELDAYTWADRAGWKSQTQQVTAVRNMTYVFANYTVTADDSNLGPNAICNVTFTGGTENGIAMDMTFNSTAALYYLNRTFDYAGNYSWNVSCSLVTYVPATLVGTLNVSVPIRNVSALGYSTNLATVNYNENVNLTLFVPNYGIDNSTAGYNISNVWANVTRPDGTVTRVFFSGNLSGGVWNGTYVASGVLGNYSVRYYSNLTNKYQIAENMSSTFVVKNTSIGIIVSTVANTTQTIPISGQIRLLNGTGAENLANNLFVISLNGVTVSSNTYSDNNFTAGNQTEMNTSNILQLNLSGKSSIMGYSDDFATTKYVSDSYSYNSEGYDSNLQRIFSLDYMTSNKGNVTYLFNSSTVFYNASVRISTATGLFDGGGNTSIHYSYDLASWSALNSSISQGANMTANVPVNGRSSFYLMLASDTNNFNNQNPIINFEINTTQYQYSASGNFVSKAIYLPNVTYTVLNWDENNVDGNIVLQIRESNNGTTWDAWSSNYTNNLVNSITSLSKDYIQYNATFTTNNLNVTPILYRLNVSYFNASTNTTGGYNYNITIPTDSLGVLPLTVSVLQSTQGIIGVNTTNVTVWANTNTPYSIQRNYSSNNANYSLLVNFTRTDTGELINGTINVTIRNQNGNNYSRQCKASQCLASWLSPEDVAYGNYTVYIRAYNESAYYLNYSTNFSDFLEFRNTTGTLFALNRTVNDLTAGVDYPFYWNISITNTGNASMLNSIVYNATKPSIIRNFSIPAGCVRIYPGETCNVTALINIAGGAQAGEYQIPFRANWSDNDGSISGGITYISYTEMYISISLNASMAISNLSVNTTIEHGTNSSFNYTVHSSGTDTLANINSTFYETNSTEYTLNSSWIQVGPSWIPNLAAGLRRNITVNISIPLQTEPGNYSGIINITSNGGSEAINLIVSVPLNGSWYLVPDTNFSYNRSFSLSSTGEIGNFTLVNVGNSNMTFNISYNPTSGALTDYSLYGTNIFAANYMAGSVLSNPTSVNVTKGENTSITLWHKGNSEPLSDVGLTLNIYNASASPQSLNIKDTFYIAEQPPAVYYTLFSFDSFATNTTIGEQNKNITIKSFATDDVDLNQTATTFNVTWPTGSVIVNATIVESEVSLNGIKVISANYSANFMPTTTGLYTVTTKVYDLAGNSATSDTFNFTVYGSTTITLSQNASSINIPDVDSTHQGLTYVNYTINNSGLVYAYSPTLTFVANSSISVQGYAFSDLVGPGMSSRVIEMNISRLTPPGQYNVTATLSWRNPNNIVSTHVQVFSINVLTNKSFIITPSTVTYGTIEHGTSNSTIVTLNNTGNYPLSSMDFNCYSGSLCSNFVLNYNVSNFGISMNSTRFANITITSPLGLAPGAYNGFVNISEQSISNVFEVQVIISTTLTWNVSSDFVSGIVQSSSSGRLDTLILNNTGNSALTFSLGSSNTSIMVPNMSSIDVPAVSAGFIGINYTSPYDEGTYSEILFINESTLTANPARMNVTVNVTVTKLTATFVSPTTASPQTDVVAGDLISINANLTYVTEVITNQTSWTVLIGSTACGDVSYEYSESLALWNVSCTAPEVEDGISHNITLTANHSSYGMYSAVESQAITYRDISPPVFEVTRNNVNKDSNISLMVNVSDNTNVNAVSALLTYPNSSQITIELSNSSNDIFTLSNITLDLAGEYIINYSANDSYGNFNSTVDWFEVYDRYGWSHKMLDSSSAAVSNANITLLRPNNTFILLNNVTNVNGLFSLNVNRRFYDVQTIISGDSVVVRNVNFTNISVSNITLNMHNYNGDLLSEIVPLYKPFIGLVNNATGLDSNDVQAMFNYTGYSYDTASQLKVVKCTSWNYADKVCDGSWSALSSSINLSSKIITGNATGFSSSAFFLAENKCGNGACEATYSEDSSSCSLDCQSSAAATSTTTSSGGGGGGGLSQSDLNKISEIVRGSINLNGVRIETTSVYREIFSGDTTTVTIKVTNVLGTETNMMLTTNGEVVNFLSYENNNIALAAGESRDVLVRIAIPKFTKPGDYVGNIVVTSGDKNGTIPTTIKVLSPEGKLLDVKLQSLKSRVAPGEILRLQLDLLNLGQTKKVDIQFELQLLDIDTGKVITRSEEAFAVETTTSTIKNLTIPEDTPLGQYLVKGVAYYASLESSNQTATSITEVRVAYPFWSNRLLFVPIWLWLSIFGAIGLVVGGVYYRRYTEFKNKRFKSKVDLTKLVQPGPNSAFIGKIAETGIRAFTDLNKLQMHTLVAGSTGGGKTVAAQAIVEAALLHNKSVIVFDPTAQWTGFFRKCEDKNMLNRYSFFDMKTGEARSFNGSIRTIHDPYEIINIIKYMNRPGEITVLDVSNLTPAQIDILAASSIEQIFSSRPDESAELKSLLVYDEVHRLLPKFGGTGKGFIQIERACREFRKWGIGLVLISQVLSDFVGEIKANIGTEIQLGTRYEGDLDRVNVKYGEDVLKSVVKEPIGTGMFVNAEYNAGRPYFISFRPLLHGTKRLSKVDLEKYEKYFNQIEDVEYQIDELKKLEADVFDIALELKLARDKVKEGQFQIADMYIESLLPNVESAWKKIGKKPVHLERKILSKEQLLEGLDKAAKERANYLKKNPQSDLSFDEQILEINRAIKEKQAKKDTSKLEARVKELISKVKAAGDKLADKEKEEVKKEIEDIKKEAKEI